MAEKHSSTITNITTTATGSIGDLIGLLVSRTNTLMPCGEKQSQSPDMMMICVKRGFKDKSLNMDVYLVDSINADVCGARTVGQHRNIAC